MNGLRWEVLRPVELATGIRRGEILNATWRDVNFDNLTMEVNSKKNTDETWEWYTKDSEHRALPLTEDLINLLGVHQNEQPEGFPYVFMPPKRCEVIQQLRRQGKWSYADTRLKPISNFRRSSIAIQKHAGIKEKTFHDLRRTTLSNWLSNGISEYDVMTLAGHSGFSTTSTWPSIATLLIGQGRQLPAVCGILSQACHRCPLAIAAAISILDRVGIGKVERSKLSVELMSVQLSPEQMVMIREILELDGLLTEPA